MATCKVLNKPDYELTLTSEEKEVTQKVIGNMYNLNFKKMMGLSDKELTLLEELFAVLNKT
jgi:hypothetical protein